MREINKSRISLLTTGGTSTAYGTGYGDYPVVGEVVRIDWSGAGLGGSGFFTITESGALVATAGIGGSALDAGEIDWYDSCLPRLKAKDGVDMSVQLMEGSAFAPYYGVGVPYCTVSGCNAGSLTIDIYFKPM